MSQKVSKASFKDPLFRTSKIIALIWLTLTRHKWTLHNYLLKMGTKISGIQRGIPLFSLGQNYTNALKPHYWEHLDFEPESTGGLCSCGHPNLANQESKQGTIPTLLILRKNKPSAKYSISDMSSIQCDFRILRSLEHHEK